MYKNLQKIPTLGMSRDEWLLHRQKHIGGSDAAAIVGLSPWCSPYTVWADKLGKIPAKEPNEATRQGTDLEDYVARRFMEATGKKVRRENAILINPAYPFAHANVDRLVVGEDAGFEAKTTQALNMKKFKNGEFPDTYYTQCVHYMMVTGAKKWYLAVLVLGRDFLTFEIERDEDEIAALAEAEKNFWGCVERNEPPMADGSASTTDTITALYPENCDSTVDLVAYERYMEQYMAISKQIKDLTTAKDEAANRIKAFMGEAARGTGMAYRVSWTAQERSTFDTKRFIADHPDINMDPYFKTSTYRTFKVTETKKEK